MIWQFPLMSGNLLKLLLLQLLFMMADCLSDCTAVTQEGQKREVMARSFSEFVQRGLEPEGKMKLEQFCPTSFWHINSWK